MYEWDFGIVLQHKWVFIEGAWITLKVTFFSIIFGTAIGGLLGFWRGSKFRTVRLLISIYVELFLALPILVLLIWIYYCGPLIIGISLSGFWTAVVTLSLTLSAFVAEIVRSGLLAVPKGHIEAGRALGMSHIQTLVRIVIPQAIMVMIPPLLSVYISCLKMSSFKNIG